MVQNSQRPTSATRKNTPLNPNRRDAGEKSRCRKSEAIQIRVTPEEKERALEAARVLSMRLATYGRFAMMYLAGAPTREEYEALGVDALMDRLERVGNNLNQLVRAANRGGIVMSNADRLVLLEVKDELEAARALFLAWREAVKTRTARLDLPEKKDRRKRKS